MTNKIESVSNNPNNPNKNKQKKKKKFEKKGKDLFIPQEKEYKKITYCKKDIFEKE